MCNLKNNPKQDTLPFETFKIIIDDLSDMGVIYTSLSGGEPLLIKDILDYISYAKSKICFVNLVTNGYLLSEKFAKDIKATKLNSISISIDALGKKNDSIRGIDGAFKQAIQGIESIKKYAPSVKITVNTVISDWNLDDIVKLVDLTEELGILHKFQPVYKHPDFDNHSIDYGWLDIKKIDIEKLRSVIAYLKRKKNVSNSTYFLSCIPDYFLSDYRKRIFNEDCVYSTFACEFREDSKIYPCIVGKGWENGYEVDVKGSIKNTFLSQDYRNDVERLKKCRLCRDNFSICYIEPRLSLPFTNLIKYSFLK